MKGAATTKAKRKAVESQLMMEEVVEKCSAAVLATGEKESHWEVHVSQGDESKSTMKTYIPAHDNIHKNQLHETKPSPFVYSVYWRFLLIFLNPISVTWG